MMNNNNMGKKMWCHHHQWERMTKRDWYNKSRESKLSKLTLYRRKRKRDSECVNKVNYFYLFFYDRF